MTLQAAANAFRSGNLRLADQLCREVLADDPTNAEAMNLFGAVSGSAGRHDLAAEWMQRAINLRPRDPFYRRNYITALISQEKFDEAAAAARDALRLIPDDAHLLALQGTVAGRQGESQQAMELLEKAIKQEPSAIAHFNLSELYRREERMDDARDQLNKALEIEPRNADALMNMAGLLLADGEFVESLRYLQQTLEAEPRSARAYGNLAVAMEAGGDVRQAAVCLRNALTIVDDDAPETNPYRFRLINLLISSGQFDEAEELLDKWQSTAPSESHLLAIRARMLERQGRLEEAIAAIESIPEGEELPAVTATRALILEVQGKKQEAAELLEGLLESKEGEALERIGVRFSLGKLYDSLGEFDRAFENYSIGNEVRRKGFGTPFDPKRNNATTDLVIESYTNGHRESSDAAGCPSELPIFIVGMPRSGTSLTEQILSAHPDVYGAGELQSLSSLVKQTHGGPVETPAVGFQIVEYDEHGPLPLVPKDFESETLRRIGEEYVDHLRSLDAGVSRITDKMPYNYLLAPLIHRALPNARIIHTRRDSIDTCLSCFFQNFSGGSEYAFDVETVGDYYLNYQRMMSHWLDELKVPMLEVDYEDLVSDPEPQIRQILEYCGLPWDDACLKSHKNKRVVVTASYQQVREPIYTKSVGRWKKYKKHLKPLIEKLNAAEKPKKQSAKRRSRA